MLSRVANSMYWLSRYLERADNIARFIRVNIHLMLDWGLERNSGSSWESLVNASGDQENFKRRFKEANKKNVLHFLTFDKKNTNSILCCVKYARENARTVREIISPEIWESINELYHSAVKHSRKRNIEGLQQFYNKVRLANYLFLGLVENAVSHEESWHFLHMGRMLERADKTARILDVKYFNLLPDPEYFDSAYDAVEWGAVLRSANAFEMYRQHHHSIDYKNVANFLVLDSQFPRSMSYCINSANHSLEKIVTELGVMVPATSEMNKLQKMLKHTAIDAILKNGLHEFVDAFQFNLNAVDQAIYKSFFDIKATKKVVTQQTFSELDILQ